jgi:hypothetical protein
MRTAGIVLVSIAIAHVLSGTILAALTPKLCEDGGGGCGVLPVAIGTSLIGSGVLLYGVPGGILWYSGSQRIDLAHGIRPPPPDPGAWSLGGGPAGSMGLSLRWGF